MGRPDARTDQSGADDALQSTALRYDSNLQVFLQNLREAPDLGAEILKAVTWLRGLAMTPGLQAGLAEEISEFLKLFRMDGESFRQFFLTQMESGNRFSGPLLSLLRQAYQTIPSEGVRQDILGFLKRYSDFSSTDHIGRTMMQILKQLPDYLPKSWHDRLLDMTARLENEILSANDALWEKVFSSMDKNVTETTISANYGDFLLSAVEKAKDQFSDEEYKTLTADAEKIRAIEEQIAALAPAEDAASSAAAQGTAFPKFEGSDLEGNPVDNSLFAGNAFTVVNFWFNGCKPCVEELDDLNALNEKVKAQGGEVIGINTETLDGNQQGIDAAKKLLETTGASYRNIYFASGSEAGKFALNIMAFPTTYVFDRDGNVVGQPLLGGIDKEENLAALQKNIDAALAKDSAK